ncbi:ABC transporter ATP-binding protein [Citrobacter sp. JGM124]|uniref:ABC transporter ATP-binding protein n=1 Tax=Citrobacter sp. JGM124 TaxID=2799789 RepID=UPI001BA86DF7|nr:ABC transporter ATP-binding protein [Citrobacter sp. JGM124]MBS0848312.1 ABC transporter ATP-binding protein [Citrobacter sp. JGM124]
MKIAHSPESQHFLHVDCITQNRPASSFPWQKKKDGSAILQNFSLSLKQDERVGLVGCSGCGKSTLLKAILGLEPLTGGMIYCEGKRVQPGSVASLLWYRQRVQYLPQDPVSSLPPMQKVKDILNEPLNRLRNTKKDAIYLRNALEQVELSHHVLDKSIAQLSGGQAQRVALARALIIKPDYLLADEPVSGLDLPLREQIKTLLLNVAKENNMGLLMVSHDISILVGLCERMLIMADGQIIEDRPTAEIIHSPHHQHTRQLLDAVPELSLPVGNDG